MRRELVLISIAFLLLSLLSVSAQSLRGTVKDLKGKPLEGVVIFPDGKKKPSTITNSKGEFKLRNIKPGTMLWFKAEGFLNRATRVPEGGTMDMTLTKGFLIPGDGSSVKYILDGDTVRVQKMINPNDIASMETDRERGLVIITTKGTGK